LGMASPVAVFTIARTPEHMSIEYFESILFIRKVTSLSQILRL
jgi:hypothetical protein